MLGGGVHQASGTKCLRRPTPHAGECATSTPSRPAIAPVNPSLLQLLLTSMRKIPQPRLPPRPAATIAVQDHVIVCALAHGINIAGTRTLRVKEIDPLPNARTGKGVIKIAGEATRSSTGGVDVRISVTCGRQSLLLSTKDGSKLEQSEHACEQYMSPEQLWNLQCPNFSCQTQFPQLESTPDVRKAGWQSSSNPTLARAEPWTAIWNCCASALSHKCNWSHSPSHSGNQMLSDRWKGRVWSKRFTIASTFSIMYTVSSSPFRSQL